MKIKILVTALVLTTALATQAQPDGRGMDPVQRAEKQTQTMVDSLSLSKKQGEKVKEINLKYAQKQQEARQANADGDWEKMRATMDFIRNEQNAELKTVLTTEQYERWQKIAEKQWKNRGKQGGPPPSPPSDKGGNGG